MTTIRKIANHTGLTHDRVEEILSDINLTPENLTLDEARIEIIKALRSGASGFVEKRELEAEAARLAQAKRIKIEAQTKGLRGDLKPRFTLEGYLTDDSRTQKYKEAEAQLLKLKEQLKDILAYQPEAEAEAEEIPPEKPQKKTKPKPKPKATDDAPAYDTPAKTVHPSVAKKSIILF